MSEPSFLVGLAASLVPTVLLAGAAVVRREFGAVHRDLVVLLGSAAAAVNVSLLVEIMAGPAGSWSLFVGALGFGAGCAVFALLRALLTPRPDRVVLLATILSAGSAVPLGYVGMLLWSPPVIPGATVAAVAGAWACHRVADGYESRFLGFITGVPAGIMTVVVVTGPASVLVGLPIGLVGSLIAVNDLLA
ncbi:hypothetical protein ACFXKD_03825 [Nocardiopsis aegyptia]|uniref:hypothetical protein n=1 Tax=Nocardiopsis aegyptia TaxID=220378 RepID=UPI00366CC0DF